MSSDTGDRRLNSWKEIGAFFGKDERTVKRWENQRGLPVHRLPGGARSTVYAYASELDSWLRGNKEPNQNLQPARVATPATVETDAQSPQPPARKRRAWRTGTGAIAALAIVVAAVALALALGVRFAGIAVPPGRVTAVHQAPAEAVELYLAGLYHWNTRTADGLNRAVTFFNDAIALDPDYAEAYAGLANAYNLLSQYTLMPPESAYPLAKAAAEHALALNDRLPTAYSALGFTSFYWLRDAKRSAELFRTSLRLDPDSALTHHWYALTLMHSGAFEEPLRAINAAQRLDPQSRSIRANKALILFHAGRVDEALKILLDLERSDPDFLPPHHYLASIRLTQSDYEGFLRESLEAARLEGNDAMRAAFMAAERGFEGGGAEGLLAALLREQRDQQAQRREKAFNVARTAALAGDSDMALAYLETSLRSGEPDILAIRIEEAFRPLHADRRFRRLVEQAGLPPLEPSKREKRAARGGSGELQGGVKQSGQEPLASIAGQAH